MKPTQWNIGIRYKLKSKIIANIANLIYIIYNIIT